MADEAWIGDVLRFWFDGLRKEQWWASTPALDATIRDRFLGLHEQVASAPAFPTSAHDALATVIVLDQFPRNMFRGTAQAFASDLKALAIADHAVGRGFDQDLVSVRRPFLYMPFMHAEDAAAASRCLALFTTLGEGDNLRAARDHKAIIDRFGRYPHRNAVLGRATTPSEQAYLAGDAKRFGQ